MNKSLILGLVLLFSVTTFAVTLTERMRGFAAEGYWTRPVARPTIDRASLVQALEKARNFYLNSQLPPGNFIYFVDLENGVISNKDNQVRQAGALWGLSCLNRDRFNDPTKDAVVKGLAFFERNIQKLKSGKMCTVYPEESQIVTGTVSLYCLALIEHLRGQEPYMTAEEKSKYRRLLDMHIEYLCSMELEDGSWAKVYDVYGNVTEPEGSPYYDGETLLVYCKAARYLGYTRLLPRIQMALPKLIAKYTADIWDDPLADPDDCKAFYQWCCMSLNEYVEAGWEPHRRLAIDTAIAYSNWLIFKELVTTRNGNTGYAVEGLVSAWNLARLDGNKKEQKLLEATVLEMMSKLMQWQYGGPFMSWSPVLTQLEKQNKTDKKYIGGIISSAQNTLVRIDIHQHQTHAMLLMLKYLFSPGLE